MSKSKRGILNKFQKMGKTLVTPVTILPIAALLLRLGQPDLWEFFGVLPNGIPWMLAAGSAIFSNLALIFAISIAVGLADKNNGVAAIAATGGYFLLTGVAKTIDQNINMGVLGGIVVGLLSSYLYNKYKATKVPDYLGFFGGKKFVLIITSIYSLLIGLVAGYVWPIFQKGINVAGNTMVNTGTKGVFLFGFLNRLLIPFGLNNEHNSIFWFEFGTYENAAGEIVKGDLNRFLALDPTSGAFMTGFFPIMMFALPAACLAMIKTAKKENKKSVTGMLLCTAFTSLLTGITAPIEFLFMFLSPALFVIHALLTGGSLAVTSYLGMKAGFEFSPGLIDYLLNFNIASKPLELLLVGLIFGVVYYFIFLFFIKKFNVPTPGRGVENESATLVNLEKDKVDVKVKGILEALGGKENIVTVEACITRIRLEVVDGHKVEEIALKDIGATGVIKLNQTNYVIVVGNASEMLVKHIKEYIT